MVGMWKKNRAFTVKNTAGIMIMVFVINVVFLFCAAKVKAEDITIALRFPKKSNAKLVSVYSLNVPQVLCDTVIVDITPYPIVVDANRYKVEYFLDDKPLYATSGVIDGNAEKLSFQYVFDTTKFANGNYRFYVNFCDEQGAAAIGSKKIVINNQE
jgi:hypothetical protein